MKKLIMHVSTTLWWKLKILDKIYYENEKSFNHPMVKVKAVIMCVLEKHFGLFQPPYGES